MSKPKEPAPVEIILGMTYDHPDWWEEVRNVANRLARHAIDYGRGDEERERAIVAMAHICETLGNPGPRDGEYQRARAELIRRAGIRP